MWKELNLELNSNQALIGTYLTEPYYRYLIEKLQLENDEATAQIRIAECIKLLLLLPDSKGTIAASSEIDEVWHWMILETKEYFKLCDKLPTQEYLHHRSVVFDRLEKQFQPSGNDANPQVGDSVQGRFANELKEKLSWLISYRNNFGEFTESTLSYWPLSKEIMKDKNLSLGQFNQILERAGAQ